MDDATHSIYVRDTVSRGEAIEGISDPDTFAVITKKPEEVGRSWVRETRKALDTKFNFSIGDPIMWLSEFYKDR